MKLAIESIVAVAMREVEVASAFQEALKSDLVVASPFLREITSFLVDYVQRHKQVPKDNDYALWVETLQGRVQAGVRGQLAQLLNQSPPAYTPELFISAAEGRVRSIATQTALSRLNEAGQELTPEVMKDAAQRVDAIRPVSLEGLASLRDVTLWIRPPEQNTFISSGLPRLDRLLGGGFGEELIFVMADSGIGKTTVLCNLGKAACFYGHKVLHVTFELATANTIHRYYRSIAYAHRSEFQHSLESVHGALMHWLRWAKGDVHVLYQDAYTITPQDLHTICSKFVDLHGGLDMLVLDYLDLMKPPEGTSRLNEYQQLGRASHQTRNLAPEFGCAVVSATQATREGGASSRLRLHHMGDSYNKVRAADIILGLSQSDEEREAYQGRISGLKIREGPGRGQEIPVFIDMDAMLVSDLDHPNTLKYIQDRGISVGATRPVDSADAEGNPEPGPQG